MKTRRCFYIAFLFLIFFSDYAFADTLENDSTTVLVSRKKKYKFKKEKIERPNKAINEHQTKKYFSVKSDDGYEFGFQYKDT